MEAGPQVTGLGEVQSQGKLRCFVSRLSSWHELGVIWAKTWRCVFCDPLKKPPTGRLFCFH